LNIIKHPRDFGTIKKKLDLNIYKTVDEFLNDMSLVFSNCKLYNGVENFAGKIGISVQIEYNRLLDMYNFFERFQNPTQIHPSVLITETLQNKSEKNEEVKHSNPEKENLINKEQNLVQANAKETEQVKASVNTDQFTSDSSISVFKNNTTMNQNKTDKESIEKGN
jgi:ribosomal protein L11